MPTHYLNFIIFYYSSLSLGTRTENYKALGNKNLLMIVRMLDNLTV